jgi:hypothetical protein
LASSGQLSVSGSCFRSSWAAHLGTVRCNHCLIMRAVSMRGSVLLCLRQRHHFHVVSLSVLLLVWCAASASPAIAVFALVAVCLLSACALGGAQGVCAHLTTAGGVLREIGLHVGPIAVLYCKSHLPKPCQHVNCSSNSCAAVVFCQLTIAGVVRAV